MKRITTALFFLLLIALGTQAQKPRALINKAEEVPVIDGVIDPVWAEAEAENDIDRSHLDQVPTLGGPGETTWQGLWTFEGIWILIRVTDDAFYPHYMGLPPQTDWQHDKVELYFDVNLELEDGGGPVMGSGHYQITAPFTEGSNDGTKFTLPSGAEYAYQVDEPNYIAEYFIPFLMLKNKDGIEIDLFEEVGFDITVIDRDPDDDFERLATWANEGAISSSWNNMDDCGIITFDEAEPPIYINEITLEGGEITENNGTLQIIATLDPPDANEGIIWTVDNNVDGRAAIATISSQGLLTGYMNGTVTVTATAATGFVYESIDVPINEQLISIGDINLIRNGFFNNVDDNNFPEKWNGGTSVDGNAYVTEAGYSVHNPAAGGSAPWSYGFYQQDFGCNSTDNYTFSLVAWGESPRNIMVGFEDISNNYNRYGTSLSEFSLTPDDYWWNSGNDPAQDWTGNSMWSIDLNTEPEKYEMDVVFDGLDPAAGEPTLEHLQFHLGLSDTVVYLDSVILVNDLDMALLTDYIEVESIEITPEGDATSVELGGTLQLSAEVLPEDARLTDVNWRVEAVDGWATINEDGLLTGDSSGLVTVYASAKDDSGVEDMLEIRVNWPAGISDYSVSPLKVYPNPAVDELTVELTSENAMVSIFNSLGQKMDEVLVNGAEYRFNISSYAKGIYFVKTNDSIVKFVK